MRASPRTSLLVALLSGATAVVLVHGLVTNGAAREPGPARTIVVAREAIPYGVPLTAANLREAPWAAEAPLAGSFGSVGEALGGGRRLALASIQRGEPILSTKVTAPNGRASLSTQIDEGMRAVTIRVDEVRGVAGFVLPGDRVDVILTRGEGGGAEVVAYADTLLQSAKVLAVDQLADERRDKPSVARAVTLELTLEQAQKVVLAQGVGRLSLALRQANGAEEQLGRRVTAGDLGQPEAAARDRIAELEAKLGQAAAAMESARAASERQAAQRLAEIEARLRGEMSRAAPPPTLAAPVLAPAPAPAVVNVFRNGSKSEPYTVSSERR